VLRSKTITLNNDYIALKLFELDTMDSLLSSSLRKKTTGFCLIFFHFVQALLLLTRHLPLKEALVLLTTIPKGILIFFYT